MPQPIRIPQNRICIIIKDQNIALYMRSAGRGQLDIPRVRLSTHGGGAFCYARPSAWNALPEFKKNNILSLSTFRRQLKHFYTSHRLY